jgi:hypothetical protein
MRWDNRGHFSNHFLDTRLQDMPQWQAFEKAVRPKARDSPQRD